MEHTRDRGAWLGNNIEDGYILRELEWKEERNEEEDDVAAAGSIVVVVVVVETRPTIVPR